MQSYWQKIISQPQDTYILKKYEECGTIGRQEGAGRKTKITAEVRRLADEMMDDDETTAKS